MIKLSNLSYEYSKNSPYSKKIFTNTSVDIVGKKTLVLGSSGSGKSTFFKILMRDLKVKKNMLDCPKNIAIVMQNVNNQIITHSVYEELNIGYRQKYNCDITKEQIMEIYNQFGVSFDLEQDPQTLSGGQKKILVIMCMIIIEPDILIFDEPLVGLDLVHRKLVLKYIEETETKLLISTHQIENLVQLCDEMILINKNEVVLTDENQVRKLAIINPKGESCEL